MFHLKEPDFDKYYSSFFGGFLFRWVDWKKKEIIKKRDRKRNCNRY